MASEKLPDSPGVIRLVARELFEPEDLDEMINMCHEEAGKYAEDIGRAYLNQHSLAYAKTQLLSAIDSRFVTAPNYRVFSLATLDRFEQGSQFTAELRQMTTQGTTAISQYELSSSLAFFAVIILTARVFQSSKAEPVPLSLLSDIAPAVWEALNG